MGMARPVPHDMQAGRAPPRTRRGINLRQLATVADQMYAAGDRARAESVVRAIYAIGDVSLRPQQVVNKNRHRLPRAHRVGTPGF